MPITLNPYLQFRGDAREAMEFYASVLGGTPAFTILADGGMGDQFPDDGDLIMHGQLITPDGIRLMGADAPTSMPVMDGDRMSVSISAEGEDEKLIGWFEGLSVDATVTMLFEVAPWGDRFGMFTDKYGHGWLINAVQPPAA